MCSTLFACAPSIYIQPLEKGEHAVNATLGGPLIAVPNIGTLPIPHSSLGYGFGISDKTTIHGNLYPTAAIYGNFQMNAGLTHEFWKQNKWGASGKIAFDYMVDTYEKNSRFWPQLDANVYYNYQENELGEDSKRKFVYCGFSNWFELNSTKAFGENQNNRMLFNPHIGHQMKKNNWAFLFEVKFLVPYLSNEKLVVDYQSIFGKRGGTGVYLGVQYHL
jgi:hypothetical protein